MSQNNTTWKPLNDSELHHIQNHRPSVRSTEASYLLQSIATSSLDEPTSLYPRLAALITSSPLVRDQVTLDATQTPAKSAVLQDLHNTAPATHRQDLAVPAAVTYAAQGNYRAAMPLINNIPTNDADGPWRETITQARLTMASPQAFKKVIDRIAEALPPHIDEADGVHDRNKYRQASFPAGRDTDTPGTTAKHEPPAPDAGNELGK
ncbi:hypothetical protein HD598_002734 [Neomicrococcus aestuarii]|uniref:Uncharacterized protein n=1 Tax=Neomicrococcus aestuarii TaxID=556325 RepID=A0A7W8TW41_9MICC|nr:hypothetical protein [Neomicrococcus aestuarii]MBB5513987.1 hypothetical protein [Neomicrococcus aestuarii]